MIDYPLGTLKDMGCDAVTIVSNSRSLGMISQHVKDGSDYGLDVDYGVQPEGTNFMGVIKATDVKGVFALMLGDCYYRPAPKPTYPLQPTLWWHKFPTANEHSVWIPEVDAIFEKPRFVDVGNRAIISYLYDERVYDFIDNENPTEIVDLHNFYRELGATMLEYQGHFADMGTPQGLLNAANYIAVNKKQGNI